MSVFQQRIHQLRIRSNKRNPVPPASRGFDKNSINQNSLLVKLFIIPVNGVGNKAIS